MQRRGVKRQMNVPQALGGGVPHMIKHMALVFGKDRLSHDVATVKYMKKMMRCYSTMCIAM